MASSDGVGGRGNGDRAKDLKSNGDSGSAPVEISVRGRIVIRSSSHPPGAGQRLLDDDTGVQLVDAETGLAASEPRAQKPTPAERPRKRRQVQAAMRAMQFAGDSSAASVPQVRIAEGGADSTLAALEFAHSSSQDVVPPLHARVALSRPIKHLVVLAIGVVVASAIAWALLGR